VCSSCLKARRDSRVQKNADLQLKGPCGSAPGVRCTKSWQVGDGPGPQWFDPQNFIHHSLENASPSWLCVLLAPIDCARVCSSHGGCPLHGGEPEPPYRVVSCTYALPEHRAPVCGSGLQSTTSWKVLRRCQPTVHREPSLQLEPQPELHLADPHPAWQHLELRVHDGRAGTHSHWRPRQGMGPSPLLR